MSPILVKDVIFTGTTYGINQVGTVTDAIEAVTLAKDANWGVVISQRSGESEDSFLSNLVVGLITDGTPCRGERLSKYNQ
ncbi:Beta-enolase [Castilleja foliolosa]|uniref:phosphopyruvate hydratase n=1 Tax=Castilleja foliolosa TaxID=1961234 RepID=A0ABD3EJW8_9LAMI